MASLAEFLRANGATDEDVKSLTEGTGSGVAKRAFEALAAKAEAESARAAAAESARKAAEDGAAGLQDWYDNVATPQYTKMQTDVMEARANEARTRAILQTAQERGLIDVATIAGYEPAKPAAAPAAAPTFDTTKYMTRDEILRIAETEGDAIALVADVSEEHRRLFPDRPFNARELRREAMAAKKPFEQYWADKYGVAAAREKRATEEKTAYEKRLRDEGAAAARQQLVDEGFNPGLRAPLPSNNIFAPRKAPDGSTKQPWEVGENQARQARLAKAMENEAKAVTH
jgi:hypothetical protein